MIGDVCKKIFRAIEIRTVVETGTFKGDTTARILDWFEEMYPDNDYWVYTVELIEGRIQSVVDRLKGRNATIICGSSEKFCAEFVKDYNGSGGLCFFLDAHGYGYHPLLDEITAICKLSKVLIIIDDFFCPGHDWEWIGAGVGRPMGIEYIRSAFNRKFTLIYPVIPSPTGPGYAIIPLGYSQRDINKIKKIIKDDAEGLIIK